MTQTPLIATANGGEWSPLMYGRVDLAKYQNASRRMINMIPLAQGPATHRPGSRHMAATRSNAYARLLPFMFNTEQAYVIEATAGKFRFYMNRGQIISGGTAYEVATPYAEADLDRVKWCQSDDVLYLWHPNYAPRKLSRTGHTAWTVTEYDPQDGPYLDENTSTTTLTPSATTGTITITASATTEINGTAGFKATDVGRQIRIKNGSPSKWGWAKITAVGSSTSVTAEVKGTLAGTDAVKTWRLGAWSQTTGWPACGCIHDDRVWSAGSRTKPNTFWGTVPGDYENFSPSDPDGTVAADHGITVTLSDDGVHSILWISSGEVLTAGTRGGEYLIRPGSNGDVLTPDNITAKMSTTKGCADAMPVQVDAAVLFIQSSRRKLHEFAYNFESDGYRSPDLTRLASHIGRAKFKAICIQKEPWGIVWGIRDDGMLVALTYLREEQVIAWSRHPMGGVFNGGQAVVESIVTIPGDGQDELWMAVKRTINGQTVRHVESLEYEFWPEDETAPPVDAVFMDAAATYRGAPATVISGLDHLEGQSVVYLADANLGYATVTGGSITLDYPYSVVHVGLYAKALYETMNLEYATNNGTTVGRVKRITEAVVRLWSTYAAKIGPDESSLEYTGVGMLSGDQVVTFTADWNRQTRVLVVQEHPLPITVTGIAPTLTQ